MLEKKDKSLEIKVAKTCGLGFVANLFFLVPSAFSGNTLISLLVCNLGLGYYFHQQGKNHFSAENLLAKGKDSVEEAKSKLSVVGNSLFTSNKKKAMQNDWQLTMEDTFRSLKIVARNVAEGGALFFDSLCVQFKP